MKKEKKGHGVQLLLRMVVRDPEEKIISDTGKKKARSFLIQFLEFLYGFPSTTIYRATATNGTEQNYVYGTYVCDGVFNVNAAVADYKFGVVIGTGDTAESNTDYALANQLTEGVGAGNISHGAVSFTGTAVVGANVDLEVKRAFTNATGSTITVKEAGVYVGLADTYFHCIIRDVLAASVEVPDKCSLTVIYTIRTTV